MGWKLFIRTWKNKYLWLLPLIKLLNMSNSSLTNFKCKKKKKIPTYLPTCRYCGSAMSNKQFFKGGLITIIPCNAGGWYLDLL
jgi:hypothetical protein